MARNFNPGWRFRTVFMQPLRPNSESVPCPPSELQSSGPHTLSEQNEEKSPSVVTVLKRHLYSL